MTVTHRLRLDLVALTSLFLNRTVLAGLLFGALLGLWSFHLTSGLFASHLFLASVGGFWGVVGAVVYVAFLRDLDLSSPAMAWFEEESVPDFEPQLHESPLAPPAPVVTPRRRAAATTTAAAPAQAPPVQNDMEESAFEAELATG